jgi:hypothetical protein
VEFTNLSHDELADLRQENTERIDELRSYNREIQRELDSRAGIESVAPHLAAMTQAEREDLAQRIVGGGIALHEPAGNDAV